MLYYKYRTASEVGLKELLYSELRFCSSLECNDPFDSKTFFEFGPDAGRWKALLQKVWVGSPRLALFIDDFSTAIAAKCPVEFKDMLQADLIYEIFDEIDAGLASVEIDEHIEKMRHYFRVYSPRISYFSSFSESNDNPLMWSHYGDRHHGFSLIFRALDGKLQQDPLRTKANVVFQQSANVRPVTFGFPSEFVFNKVSYESRVIPLDAFNCFPSNDQIDEETRLKLATDSMRNYYEKHISWEYEKEVRLNLFAPHPWLVGAKNELSSERRLFHYNPSQLVGVILGALVSKETKQRIIEICQIRDDWIARANGNRIQFNFMIFQAKFVDNQRSLSIIPEAILANGELIRLGEARFNQFFYDWHEGKGIKIENGGASQVQY
jgi:hypothetical protein